MNFCLGVGIPHDFFQMSVGLLIYRQALFSLQTSTEEGLTIDNIIFPSLSMASPTSDHFEPILCFAHFGTDHMGSYYHCYCSCFSFMCSYF